MSEFHTPSLEEFRLAALHGFGFLTAEYGFKETKAPAAYENPYSVFFRRSRRFVYVEGFSYGMSLGVSLGRISWRSRMREQLPLSVFMRLREPQMLESRYPSKRGQLEEMKFAAAALRRCAADFLAGDLSILPQALHLQAERNRASGVDHDTPELQRIFMRASDAFHGGQFELTVRLLEPHSSALGKAQQALLNLARKRIVSGQEMRSNKSLERARE